MKTILLVMMFCSGFFIDQDKAPILSSEPDISQELIGAWEALYNDSVHGEVRAISIIADGYVSVCNFSATNNEFISTNGGSWSAQGVNITRKIEYNTVDQGMVGQELTTTFTLTGNTLSMDEDNKIWKRVDYGTPGALAGAYLITGRKRDGEIKSRTPGARKTMKILSGKRFQWIAYNTETGEFFGTGGGTYTTVNGKYTENIVVFSRDVTRVGASLEFDFELDLSKGEWHHSGLSSKGSPIYEIWTSRSVLDKK